MPATRSASKPKASTATTKKTNKVSYREPSSPSLSSEEEPESDNSNLIPSEDEYIPSKKGRTSGSTRREKPVTKARRSQPRAVTRKRPLTTKTINGPLKEDEDEELPNPKSLKVENFLKQTPELNLSDSDFHTDDEDKVATTKTISVPSEAPLFKPTLNISPVKGSDSRPQIDWDILISRLEQNKTAGPSTSNAAPVQEEHPADVQTTSSEDENELEDWEDVEQHHQENAQPSKEVVPPHVIPESVEITISVGGLAKKCKSLSAEALMKRELNRVQREHYETLHQMHLMSLYSHARQWNKCLNQPELQACVLSRLAEVVSRMPQKVDRLTLEHLNTLLTELIAAFPVGGDFSKESEVQIGEASDEIETFQQCVASGQNASQRFHFFLMILLLRALGLPTRLVIVCDPLPLKPSEKMISNKASSKKKATPAQVNRKPSSKKKQPPPSSPPQKENTKKKPTKSKEPAASKRKTPRRASKLSKKSYQESSHESEESDASELARSSSKKHQSSESDDDSDYEAPLVALTTAQRAQPTSSRKVISPEMREDFFMFCEFYLPKAKQWLVFGYDLILYQDYQKRLSTTRLNSKTPHWMCSRFLYVLGFDEEGVVSDLAPKFDPLWAGANRKFRVKDEWLSKVLLAYRKPRRRTSTKLSAVKTAAEKQDVAETEKFMYSHPLPRSLNEFKSHPLYVLRRHLLKYEVIHPEDQKPVAVVANEAVYSRSSVKLCHTRETWLKEGLVIKKGEKPAKLVKAVMSMKRKLLQGDSETKPMVELYGEWQTAPYDPPSAENGRVPRNDHGNVDLYKLSMLPKGCRYLKLPGLGRLANKLGLDAAEAVTGWEFHAGGWAHPVRSGWVVCEEHADTLIDAWKQNWREERRKEAIKRQQRALTNWKRIIKTLLIRARLRSKYDFKESNEETTFLSTIAKGMQEKMKLLEQSNKKNRGAAK